MCGCSSLGAGLGVALIAAPHSSVAVRNPERRESARAQGHRGINGGDPRERSERGEAAVYAAKGPCARARGATVRTRGGRRMRAHATGPGAIPEGGRVNRARTYGHADRLRHVTIYPELPVDNPKRRAYQYRHLQTCVNLNCTALREAAVRSGPVQCGHRAAMPAGGRMCHGHLSAFANGDAHGRVSTLRAIRGR